MISPVCIILDFCLPPSAILTFVFTLICLLSFWDFCGEIFIRLFLHSVKSCNLTSFGWVR